MSAGDIGERGENGIGFVIDNLLLLIIFAISLVAAYFFAYAEAATVAAERIMLHHASMEGNQRAKLVEAFLSNPRKFSERRWSGPISAW